MIRAAWQHVRHRTAIDLSCGSIPPRNFARSTTIVALHVEAIEHMLDHASVVRQVAGPSTHVAFIALTPNGNYWWYTLLGCTSGYRSAI
jgi:hypothetical protein